MPRTCCWEGVKLLLITTFKKDLDRHMNLQEMDTSHIKAGEAETGIMVGTDIMFLFCTVIWSRCVNKIPQAPV